MEIAKIRVGKLGPHFPIFERIRGYVQLENADDSLHDTDFQLNLRNNEVSVKSFKNKDARLDQTQLGLMVYGRNILDQDGNVNPLIKEALKCARSRLPEIRKMRNRDSVTDDEIAMLEEKYLGEDLPTAQSLLWEWTGFCYQNMHSDSNERCYEHPNREFLIKRYLDELNGEIGSLNRDV